MGRKIPAMIEKRKIEHANVCYRTNTAQMTMKTERSAVNESVRSFCEKLELSGRSGNSCWLDRTDQYEAKDPSILVLETIRTLTSR